MKKRDIDLFDRYGRDLFNLALKLDSSALEETGGRKKRSPVSQARQAAITALGAVIQMVSVLLRKK